MIARSSIAAGLATMIVAVPAAWHVLDADIQADGPKVRPPEQVLHLDGADVSTSNRSTTPRRRATARPCSCRRVPSA